MKIKSITILVLVLLLGFSSCGKSTKNSEKKDEPVAIYNPETMKTNNSENKTDIPIKGFWKSDDNILALEDFGNFELFNKIPLDEPLKDGEYYIHGQYEEENGKYILTLANIPKTVPSAILDAINKGKIEIRLDGIGGPYSSIKFYLNRLTFTYLGDQY